MHAIWASKELPETTCTAPIGVMELAKIRMWSPVMEGREVTHMESIGCARRNNKCSILRLESVGKPAIASE